MRFTSTEKTMHMLYFMKLSKLIFALENKGAFDKTTARQLF